MAFLYIRADDSVFKARDNGAEYEHPADALSEGVKAAVAMAAEEIRRGQAEAVVDIYVEDADDSPVLHSCVTVSVACLQIA